MSVKERSAAPASKSSAAAAATSAVTIMDYPTFLSKLGTKDRLNVERHLAICEAEPDPAHATYYRKLISILGGLAPHAVKTHGQQAVQFFIPDGKYRMQVFALR